jgi:hypothetical protein
MDLYRIIDALHEERNRLQLIIQSLESAVQTRVKTRGGQKKKTSSRPGRPGRKSMDAAARRDVSARMKLYWARRREGETPVPPPARDTGKPESSSPA